MSPITKLHKKFKVFEWTKKCQNVWEEKKTRYVQTLILISLNWELEFHVHTYASQLALGAIFTHNSTSKFDQLVMYASILLNFAEKNYITNERSFSYGLCSTQIQELLTK
jgi:hypothetical protein